MYLIVGLGNPGSQYELTRHNAGFIITDMLAKDFDIDIKFDKNLNANIGKGSIYDHDIYILQPMTYMNLSGGPVAKLTQFYKIDPDNIIVLHDEIDIPNADIRYKFGGSVAGHNGLKNISLKLGTNNYHRIRLGVDRPANANISIADRVLSKFRQEELSDLTSKYIYIQELIQKILSKG